MSLALSEPDVFLEAWVAVRERPQQLLRHCATKHNGSQAESSIRFGVSSPALGSPRVR